LATRRAEYDGNDGVPSLLSSYSMDIDEGDDVSEVVGVDGGSVATHLRSLESFLAEHHPELLEDDGTVRYESFTQEVFEEFLVDQKNAGRNSSTSVPPFMIDVNLFRVTEHFSSSFENKV